MRTTFVRTYLSGRSPCRGFALYFAEFHSVTRFQCDTFFHIVTRLCSNGVVASLHHVVSIWEYLEILKLYLRKFFSCYEVQSPSGSSGIYPPDGSSSSALFKYFLCAFNLKGSHAIIGTSPNRRSTSNRRSFESFCCALAATVFLDFASRQLLAPW